jgi:hypothetical protein
MKKIAKFFRRITSEHKIQQNLLKSTMINYIEKSMINNFKKTAIEVFRELRRNVNLIKY